jgi:Ala-tRNA(Pro) deacylase
MAAANWIKAMLESRGIAYQERHHSVAFTATELAEREHVSGHRVAKVVVVIADGRPVELVLPASRNVLLGKVARILDAREVRLASEQELAGYFTECEVGAVPPLRCWRDVEVLMDEAMRVDGEILFSAGTHSDAVVVDFRDWVLLVNPRRGSFSTTAELRDLGIHRSRAGGEDGDVCGDPARLQCLLSDLLDVLHLQAKEIERLTSHVEQQTDPMLERSQMPLVVSELSSLQSRLGDVPPKG